MSAVIFNFLKFLKCKKKPKKIGEKERALLEENRKFYEKLLREKIIELEMEKVKNFKK